MKQLKLQDIYSKNDEEIANDLVLSEVADYGQAKLYKMMHPNLITIVSQQVPNVFTQIWLDSDSDQKEEKGTQLRKTIVGHLDDKIVAVASTSMNVVSLDDKGHVKVWFVGQSYS